MMPALLGSMRRLRQSLPLLRLSLLLLEVVSIATSSTTASVPVRDEVLTLTGTLRAFVLLHSGTEMTPSRQEATMGSFGHAQDNIVIIQILASIRRIIITTLITFAFSLILPFASLVRGIILLGLVTISS